MPGAGGTTRAPWPRIDEGTMRIFGTHDEKTLAQFKDISSRAVDAALMSDGTPLRTSQ